MVFFFSMYFPPVLECYALNNRKITQLKFKYKQWKILAGKYTIIGEEKSDKTEPQNGLAKVFVKSYPAGI